MKSPSDYPHEQLSCLDSRGLARSTDPPTSHAAAFTACANLNEAIVLRLLAEQGPETIVGITDQTGNYGGISPRFRPLANRGLIEDTGELWENPSGRKAIAWRITPAGREALANTLRRNP